MNVIVNRWLGEGFESDVKCKSCGQLATVVQLPLYDPETPVVDFEPVCAGCLTEALNAISQALLAHSAFKVVDL